MSLFLYSDLEYQNCLSECAWYENRADKLRYTTKNDKTLLCTQKFHRGRGDALQSKL